MASKIFQRPSNPICVLTIFLCLFLCYLSLRQISQMDSYPIFKIQNQYFDNIPSNSSVSSTKRGEIPIAKITATKNISSNSSKTSLEKVRMLFNKIGMENGSLSTSYLMLKEFVKKAIMDRPEEVKNATVLLSRLKKKYSWIQQYLSEKEQSEQSMPKEVLDMKGMKDYQEINSGKGSKVQINLAAVACGKRSTEDFVMLKSAVLFSQDASLHIILFSDEASILNVAADLMELKWTVNALGRDLTFELHFDWFPEDASNEWKKMYRKCATQRLFFPSLLPHIDSLIYLDTDTIVVSNLTEFWLEFSKHMKVQKMAGMSANNEPNSMGWYNVESKIPHYGSRGLNAGIMLMNLTQMRNFSFEERAMATLVIYKEKIELADQDILNIIFHTYPERLFELDCSYNFNWVHCGFPEYNRVYPCVNETTGESVCFCNVARSTGIKIVHGNSGCFHNYKYFEFMRQLYQDFQHFDLLKDSPVELILKLKQKFEALPEKPCHPLTSEILYGNALQYLQKLTKSFQS